MTSATPVPKARPLSPHLQIYKPQITSVLSIFHRGTGIMLAAGMVVLVAWLAALAGGFDCYTAFVGYAQTWVGTAFLVALSFSFFYHLCAGVRHLLWDAGYFLELKQVYTTGRIVVLASVVMTALLWLKIYGVGL